jgi:hypothetical protein
MSKTYKVVYNNSYGGFGLSEKAIAMLYELGLLNDEVDYWDYRSIERHNPHLVRVVEELGDLASSSFSSLKIAEIISPIYKIDEYDGAESVVTPDKIAWVKIE